MKYLYALQYVRVFNTGSSAGGILQWYHIQATLYSKCQMFCLVPTMVALMLSFYARKAMQIHRRNAQRPLSVSFHHLSNADWPKCLGFPSRHKVSTSGLGPADPILIVLVLLAFENAVGDIVDSVLLVAHDKRNE